MKSEDFELYQKVRINQPGHLLHGMSATVVGYEDSDSVEVHFDVITSEMMGYSDTKKGLAIVNCNNLIKI